MKKKALYTIGYGNRNPEVFLSLLKEFKIEYLIDIRSKPYSKYNPSFNQNELKRILELNSIKYVFMGDTIGGRPTDLSCYDSEGKVNYDAIKGKEFFQSGIDRLKTAYSKNINVVLMCSESKPCECHRSKLIGAVLDIEKITLSHIDEYGNLKDQTLVINEANKGLSSTDLFGITSNLTSRKAYI